jgi:hypothetical protein
LSSNVGYRGQTGNVLLVMSLTGLDPEQTFADPGNSRVAQDMRRVDIETEREGSHDVLK